MGLFVRGQKLWARFKDESGRWVNRPTGYSVGDEAKATRFLATISGLSARARARPVAGSPRADQPTQLTVAKYVERWLEERKDLGLASWSDDAARLRLHVVPVIGQVALADVSPRHLKQLVTHHRKEARLAPRTIRHIYGVTSTMFKDAVADELIRSSPCVLRKGVLPKKVDKDPEWRATAI